MTSDYKEQKYIFLAQEGIEKEKIDEINANIICLTFSDKSYQSGIGELLDRFQGIILNMSEQGAKTWYASQKKNIMNNKTVKRIYVAKNGQKLEVKKIKENYDTEYVIKKLPQAYKNATDFAQRILMDHIGSDNKGILKIITKWLSKKCC